MRYCPSCKKMVGKKFTGGQVILMFFLLSLAIFPGILYGLAHTRKCPICGTPTKGHAPKDI